jgi:hypothetical protein
MVMRYPLKLPNNALEWKGPPGSDRAKEEEEVIDMHAHVVVASVGCKRVNVFKVSYIPC